MEASSSLSTRVEIRTMTEDDIPAILEIDRKLSGGLRTPTYQSSVESYIGGELSLSCVAEDRGRIVGFITGECRPVHYMERPHALIELIGIDPEYQRRGIATRLIEAFGERCRERGALSVHAMISVGDEAMRSLLRSLDFTMGEMVTFQMAL
ncbi:MAG: GNAT family N-acetyltransferase [Dehalococcoidia bacterium]